MTFQVDGYEVVKNAISKESAEILAIQFDIMCSNDNLANRTNETDYAFGDSQVPQSYCSYSPIWSEALLVHMLPVVSQVSGFNLVPTYSYSRIYYRGADMKIHSDRPSCQISATITIKAGEHVWPIWFKNRKAQDVKLILDPGDMVVYSGCELLHWRNEFNEADKQTQVFLHYVDASGPFKEHVYDGRQYLGQQKNK